MNKKINIVTLGCSKNIVDSEHVGAQLRNAGYSIVYDSNDADAKVVIVNTCGFIGDAKEESVNTILEFARAREAGAIEKLFVIGCLSERYAAILREEIPEVDEYFGARDFRDIVNILTCGYDASLDTSRVISTPDHYAYLKIAEGCNWHCAYCAIPSIRGKYVSVPMERLVEEAEGLARGGVKELIVIAQDTTYYGMDLYGERRLAKLLRRLAQVEGIEWIRLHYTYPTGFPDDVIEAIGEEPKICKYIDLPLQHISDSQLSAMHRNIDRKQTAELIAKLRRRVPGITIRTTMLVGFPGEREEDFRELMDFVAAQKFERLGVFPYSEEEGTPSALNFADDVPQQVKESRVERLMELQRDISLAVNRSRAGQKMKVIVDRREGDYYVARSEYDSPEVDPEILIPASRKLRKGGFYNITITEAEDYDLYGELD